MTLQYDAHNVPWGVGFLSVSEMMQAMKRMHLSGHIVFSPDVFLSSDVNVILLKDHHYIMRFKVPGSKTWYLFDSAGVDHCRTTLGVEYFDRFDGVKFVKRYQTPDSDYCGQFVLFLLSLAYNIKSDVSILDAADKYLPNPVANQFLMVLFTCKLHIGEEFDANDRRYESVQHMLKYTESLL
jgi:hypothetical protein